MSVHFFEGTMMPFAREAPRRLRSALAAALCLVVALFASGGLSSGTERSAMERGTPQASGVVAFEHVTVVPMDRERVIERQTVLVRDGRIAAVGNESVVPVPSGALRVD